MPARELNREALASFMHECLEERDGRFYGTLTGAERITGWLRGQGFPTVRCELDGNGRFRIVHGGGQAARHLCHWPDCPIEVPPALWGCREHWFALPPVIRSRIWRHYRKGQELDKNPSQEYLAVAAEAQAWAIAHPVRRPRRR